MLHGLYLFCDDDFAHPLHADPDRRELDDEVWQALCESVDEALDGDGRSEGHLQVSDELVGWRVLVRLGLSFVAVVSPEVRVAEVERYLRDLSRRYLDEVDDPRNPELEGVADVLVDVIPPWEE